MTQTLPIYNINRPVPKLKWFTRVSAFVIALGCMTVLTIGAILNPDPSGMETHRQLGLGSCALLQNTGIPCLTCGMTTAYAHMLHGNVYKSFITQPMGAILCFATGIALWASLYVAATGLPGALWLNRFPTMRQVVVFIALMLSAWIYKLIITVNAHP
ncbi:MAG TPA: DUF2752 domain-containing protein [Tepidisphaeraceae bacterium]|nr:DUF2752 domain-containing protein [Tepidisphaeraceae bacterium]